MNVGIHYFYWKQGTWPRLWQRDNGLENTCIVFTNLTIFPSEASFTSTPVPRAAGNALSMIQARVAIARTHLDDYFYNTKKVSVILVLTKAIIISALHQQFHEVSWQQNSFIHLSLSKICLTDNFKPWLCTNWLVKFFSSARKQVFCDSNSMPSVLFEVLQHRDWWRDIRLIYFSTTM